MKWSIQALARAARPDGEGWMQLAPRSIYILPNRHGILFGMALFVMLIGSLNYGSNLGLLFTFLFAGIGLTTILHTWRNLAGVKCRVETATPVFAGSDAIFTVQLGENGDRERSSIQVTKNDADSGETNIPVRNRVSRSLHVPTRNRGEMALGRLKVSTRFPLGLLVAWAYADTTATVLVYPKPSSSQPLQSGPHYAKSEKGDKGVGADDFVGPRPYRPGDSPRHLDWKAFARERGLVTRQFGGDRAEEIWLDFEQFSGLENEERLSRLCRMILDASSEDVRYGLRLPEGEIEPSSGDAHKHHCLSALARFGGGGNDGLV